MAHASGNPRFGRKRPSMLSEFHGNKHYNAREGERERYVAGLFVVPFAAAAVPS